MFRHMCMQDLNRRKFIVAFYARCRRSIWQLVNELKAVLSQLGGHLAMGRDVHSDEQKSAAIGEGFHTLLSRAYLGPLASSPGDCIDARSFAGEACNAGGARADWCATSRIASTGSHVSSRLPATSPRRSPACPGFAPAAEPRDGWGGLSIIDADRVRARSKRVGQDRLRRG